MARPTQRLFHLVFETHNGRALVPIPERSASPRATSNTAVVDGLKVLDPKRPIREADMLRPRTECQLWATGRHALQKAEKIRQQIIRSRWPRNRHPPSSRRHLGFKQGQWTPFKCLTARCMRGVDYSWLPGGAQPSCQLAH